MCIRDSLRVKGHQKKIVEDEQLTSFDFLELGLKIVLDFCDLELSEQFGGCLLYTSRCV